MEFAGIHGVVADIIKAQLRYEVALEVALGTRLQDIVVDNENTAKKAIAFLKENNLGRATFIPLNRVKGYLANSIAGARLASELVEYDPKYAEVVKYLLGRILIVENMEDALRLQNELQNTQDISRIVTVSGEIITPQGSMTGGAIKHQTTLLGRQREIIELERVVGALRNQLEEIKQEKVQLEEKQKELSLNQEECSGQIQHNEIEDKTLLNEKTRLDLEIQKISNEIKNIEDSAHFLREDLDNIRQRHQEMENELGRQNMDKENMSATMSNKELEIKNAHE
ncbi:MAG: hypothetical protein KKA19_08600, partial [Candidatus Margulisbacteria bacterium]|nr:hypothetical protein [Candidatus Margulisiibacteriota bacterium]